MRKLVVLTFITLDGVMQAPGGPEEDQSDGFEHGGWSVGYFDDELGNVMAQQMGHPFDLLLGRKTYDIFAAYWPRTGEDDPAGRVINRATKYVVSHRPVETDWKPTVVIDGDVPAEIARLKREDGPELQVHGSGNLIQTLLRHDLVDEFWLKIYPVALGTGKRLFGEGTMPSGFRLIESKVTPSGVVVANYARGGEIKSGSFALAASGEEASRS
jgi:dihydrofolate reductase